MLLWSKLTRVHHIQHHLISFWLTLCSHWSLFGVTLPYRTDKASTNQLLLPFECYSCMSNYYKTFWNEMQTIYSWPGNFTDACNHLDSPRSLSLTKCRSTCVVLKEELYAGGIKLQKHGYIRGCWATLLRDPFTMNASVLEGMRYAFRPSSCRELDRQNLIVLSKSSRHLESPLRGPVQFCSCAEDRCHSKSNAAQSSHHFVAGDKKFISHFSVPIKLLLLTTAVIFFSFLLLPFHYS